MTVERDKAAAQLTTLSEITSERPPEPIRGILEAAMEELGMEVAFVSEFDRQRMVFRKLVGEAGSFGWEEGESVPLDDTFCRLLLEGRLPNAIANAKADGRVRFLEITGKAGIGSYVGAPIRLSDGALYGTLCVLSHSPEPSLARPYESKRRAITVLLVRCRSLLPLAAPLSSSRCSEAAKRDGTPLPDRVYSERHSPSCRGLCRCLDRIPRRYPQPDDPP